MEGSDHRELQREEIFSFDPQRYDFVSILYKIFNTNDLSRLHELLEGASEANFIDFDNDQGTWFHKTYYNSPHLPELLGVYERLIKEVIAPTIKGRRIIYQKKPSFRVHLPNNVAVGHKHRDSDYAHPPGEINFWLPFTRVWGTNGLFVETAPDEGDFHGLEMEYGQIFRFYGSKCWHYNLANDTGATRVSIDFRIIPGDRYDESHEVRRSVKAQLQFKIGSYYDVHEKQS